MDKTYKIENNICKIIDGDLWVKCNPVNNGSKEMDHIIDTVRREPKNYYKKGKKTRLTDSQIETMLQRYEDEDISVEKLVRGYGISTASFYKYKTHFKNKKGSSNVEEVELEDDNGFGSNSPRTPKIWECLGCAKEFLSILPVPRCPDCRGKTKEVINNEI